MATRTREPVPGREKRVTSPSHAPPHTGTTTPTRKSPSTSKTTSPAPNRILTPDKHIPNYLKHTESSGTDVSKQQGKKPVSGTDIAHKHTNLMRQKSFDKPPTLSQTQKTHVSPNPILRSSSFSGKTVTSQKQVPVAAKDAGKQRSLHARPVKPVTKTIYVKKQGTGTSNSTKAQATNTPEKVISPNPPDSSETETEVKEVSSISEAEEPKEIAEIPVLENKEQINTEQTEAKSDKEPKIVAVESAIESQIEGTNKQQELEQTRDEISDNNTDESVAGNPDGKLEEKDGEKAITLNEKEDIATEIEAEQLKEKEVEEVAEEEKQEVKIEAPKQVVAQGKKDSALSNDVIEETASKLREQRKNKVRALAGAFETVISMQ